MTSLASSAENATPGAVAGASLVLWEGGRAGRALPLDASVVRVGSHLACGLCVEGVEPHVLTVERSGGRYFVHSRAGHPLKLGDGHIGPRGSAAWEPGDHLVLTGGLELELRAGDASGPRAPHPRGAGGGPAATAATPPAPGRAAPGPSWAVIVPLTLTSVALWVACQGLATRHPTGADGSGVADRPAAPDELDDLVAALQVQGDEGRYVAHQLQVAAQDEECGRRDAALARRLRLRDRLLRQRPSTGRFADHDQALGQALRQVSEDPE